MIFFHGLAGAYDSLAQSVASSSVDAGFSFIWAGTQSTFINNELQKTDNSTIHAGGAYEKFSNTYSDMSAWIDFAIKENYKNIIFIGHCYGCNKIVYLLNKLHIPQCKGCILLAPIDLNDLKKSSNYKNLVNEAVKNVKNNNKNKILSDKVLGFCEMTSGAYLRLLHTPHINNIPYKTQNGDFSMIQNISLPIHSVIGTKDRGLDEDNNFDYASQCMQTITNNCKIGSYEVVREAKHSFKGSETIIYDIISDKLNEYKHSIENEENLF